MIRKKLRNRCRRQRSSVIIFVAGSDHCTTCSTAGCAHVERKSALVALVRASMTM